MTPKRVVNTVPKMNFMEVLLHLGKLSPKISKRINPAMKIKLPDCNF